MTFNADFLRGWDQAMNDPEYVWCVLGGVLLGLTYAIRYRFFVGISVEELAIRIAGTLLVLQIVTAAGAHQHGGSLHDVALGGHLGYCVLSCIVAISFYATMKTYRTIIPPQLPQRRQDDVRTGVITDAERTGGG